MSIPFSNTTTKNGIIQQIEKNIGFDDGQISGNATLLSQFTADVNLAMDKVLAMIFQVGGTWNFDDSNQTDYPIITTNLVNNQRDYSFVTDGAGNLVLDVFRVFVANSNGVFSEIYPVDVSSGQAPASFTDAINGVGIPSTYDKNANSIFLDPIPNYNYTNGLKVYINRESTYFTTSDTTKKAGFAGLFHEYLALRPAYQYAYRKGLNNVNSLEKEMLKMESDLENYYKSRAKDVQKRLIPIRRNSR